MDEYEEAEIKVYRIRDHYFREALSMMERLNLDVLKIDGEEFFLDSPNCIKYITKRLTFFSWSIIAFIIFSITSVSLYIFSIDIQLGIFLSVLSVIWLTSQPLGMLIFEGSFSLIDKKYDDIKNKYAIDDQITLLKKMTEVLKPKVVALRQIEDKENKEHQEKMLDKYNEIIAMEELDINQ